MLSRLSRILLLTLIGVLVLYVVSYFTLLTRGQPEQVEIEITATIVYPNAGYRIESELVTQLYLPLHVIDERIRPDFWSHRPIERKERR